MTPTGKSRHMNTPTKTLGILGAAAALSLGLASGLSAAGTAPTAAPAAATASAAAEAAKPSSYIVQAASLAEARARVTAAGGKVSHELGIIDAVAALLTPAQASRLDADPRLVVPADAAVKTQGGTVPNQYARQQLNVEGLAAQGFDGSGVTVAILDTGIWYSRNEVKNDVNGKNKILAMYDAIANKLQNTPDKTGHGSHVASIIGSPRATINGQPINQQGYLWSNGSTWSQSFVPSVSSFAGTNNWVEQE